MKWVLGIALMMALAFAQNTSFSLVSRARNRNHLGFHMVAAILSNAVWFATSKYLIINQGMSWLMFVPYTIGTVGGSMTGSQISMWIEKKLKIVA